MSRGLQPARPLEAARVSRRSQGWSTSNSLRWAIRPICWFSGPPMEAPSSSGLGDFFSRGVISGWCSPLCCAFHFFFKCNLPQFGATLWPAASFVGSRLVPFQCSSLAPRPGFLGTGRVAPGFSCGFDCVWAGEYVSPLVGGHYGLSGLQITGPGYPPG